MSGEFLSCKNFYEYLFVCSVYVGHPNNQIGKKARETEKEFGVDEIAPMTTRKKRVTGAV